MTGLAARAMRQQQARWSTCTLGSRTTKRAPSTLLPMPRRLSAAIWPRTYLDDLAADRQSQSGMLAELLALRTLGVEAIKYLLRVAFGDAWAIVLDTDLDHAAGFARAQRVICRAGGLNDCALATRLRSTAPIDLPPPRPSGWTAHPLPAWGRFRGRAVLHPVPAPSTVVTGPAVRRLFATVPHRDATRR